MAPSHPNEHQPHSQSPAPQSTAAASTTMQPPESATEAPASTAPNTHPEFHPQAPQDDLPFDHDIDPVVKRHLEDVDMVDITPISTPKRVHTPSRLQYQLDPNGNSASNGHLDAPGTPPPGANTTGPRRVNASHGAPVRRYLNEKVTGVLLEGMKKVGREQPIDPLKMLGDFLLEKSKEMEGGLHTYCGWCMDAAQSVAYLRFGVV